MIILPKNSVIIQRDKPVESSSGIILNTKPTKPNTGTIIFTHESLNHLQLGKAVFRESFIEEIDVEGKQMVFVRDFDSAIYYVTTDKK